MKLNITEFVHHSLLYIKNNNNFRASTWTMKLWWSKSFNIILNISSERKFCGGTESCSSSHCCMILDKGTCWKDLVSSLSAKGLRKDEWVTLCLILAVSFMLFLRNLFSKEKTKWFCFSFNSFYFLRRNSS